MKIGTPTYRMEIIYCLLTLSDFDLQKKDWISKEREDAFWWGLNLTLEFLLEDMWLLDDDIIEERIFILRLFYSREEYRRIKELLNFLEGNINSRQTDKYYLTHPLWPKVIEMAKEAYDLLMANNHKYNFEEELEEFQKMTPEEVEKHWEERDKHLNN